MPLIRLTPIAGVDPLTLAAILAGHAARDAAWEALIEDREVTWLKPRAEVSA